MDKAAQGLVSSASASSSSSNIQLGVVIVVMYVSVADTRGFVTTVSSAIAVVCSAEYGESTADSSSVVTALGWTYCENESVVSNSCSPVVSLVSVDDMSASGVKSSVPVFVS